MTTNSKLILSMKEPSSSPSAHEIRILGFDLFIATSWAGQNEIHTILTATFDLNPDAARENTFG